MTTQIGDLIAGCESFFFDAIFRIPSQQNDFLYTRGNTLYEIYKLFGLHYTSSIPIGQKTEHLNGTYPSQIDDAQKEYQKENTIKKT
jgi:hypothetical protein